MSESNERVEHPTKKQGPIGKTSSFIFRVIGLLVFSAFLSIVIEWIGMTFFYPEEGYKHAQKMMEKEMGYLGASLSYDKSNADAVNTASNFIGEAINFIFVDSGLLGLIKEARTLKPDDGDFIAFFKGLFNEYYNYAMAAIYIFVMFMIRLAILILSIPAFALFTLVGFSDGLMQRDLRRWCGGNESGFIYHWAKKFSLPILLAAWVIYLAIPSSIHPNFIITPFAVLFGLVVMVMASKFKKYL